MNPKPVHADYSRKLQKVLFIYILPLSFGLFPTKRGKNGLCAHLITFATTLFSVHIRFSNFRFWCKEWTRNSNSNTECSTQNCNPFFSVSFILLQNGASLFTTWSEYEAKNVLCFCHFFVSHFVTWEPCAVQFETSCPQRPLKILLLFFSGVLAYGYFIAVTIVVVVGVVSSLVANGITNGIIAQAARYTLYVYQAPP